MKRIYICILLLFGFLVSFGQTLPMQTIGNSGNIVVAKGFLGFDTAMVFRTSWADTTAANGGSYLKNQRGAQIRVADTIFQRSHDLLRWFKTGAGSLIVDTSSSARLFGNGASGSPLTAEVIISPQNGNAIESTGGGLFVRNFVQDGITEPGVITWVSGYTYDVSPAVGVIGGVEYTSAWTPITLAASHATLNRIDLVVFNAGVGSSTGTITVITGTPAADPVRPTLATPSTQLAMAFILVTANTTQPPSPPAQDWIYINNAEWTTLSSTARINAASTTNPYSVPLDVQGTLAQNNDNIRFTSVSPPTISNFSALTLKIRAASIWFPSSRIRLRWYSGGTPIGGDVSIANGSFGFSSTNLLSYQIISIPLSDFGALSSVTNLLITVQTIAGRTISFYIDDIQLQAGTVPPVGYTASNGITLVGSDFQLGGTFNKETTLTSNGHTLTISGSAATSNLSVSNTHATGGGIISTAQAGYGLQGSSTTGVGVIAQNSSTVVNTVTNALQVIRKISGTPSAGIGGAIEYLISTASDPFTPQRSNRLISEWTDEGLTTRTAKFTITGVLNAVESDLFTLSGNGSLKLNKYTTSAFAGTPVNTLQTDASGNIIQGAVSISTADNGLTKTGNNVQLGGTLLQNTSINATSSFNLTITGSGSSAPLQVSNTSTGNVMQVTASGAGTAVNAQSSTGTGINSFSTSGLPMILGTDPSSTNTVVQMLKLQRETSATAANGIGGSIDFIHEVSTGSVANIANQIISKWTDATTATRTSQFIITGVNSAVTADLAQFNGNGYVLLPGTGTPTYTLESRNTSGTAIYGNSTTGVGIQSVSTSNTALSAVSTNGGGISAQSTSGIAAGLLVWPASTNTVTLNTQIQRLSTGVAADGIGTSVDFIVQTTSGAGSAKISNQFISKWPTANDATRVSQFILTGVNNAATQDIIYFEGNGRTRFNGRAQYQQGVDVASVAGAIAVGLDGNVFELTGTNAVTLISNLNWQNGSEITLVFTSTASLTDGTANSGTDIGMELAGNVNFVGSADDVITLSLTEVGGVQRWREKSRSVN